MGNAGGVAAAAQGSTGKTTRESCHGAEGTMLLGPGRIKAKGERQKVRRSMLPATRNTMKTLHFGFPSLRNSRVSRVSQVKVIENVIIHIIINNANYARSHNR